MTGIEIGTVVAIGTAVHSMIPPDPFATDRQCIITLSNHSSHTLFNARSYMNSGSCTTTLPHRLPPGHKVTVVFQKTAYSFRGCCGVFTFELHPGTNPGQGKNTKLMSYLFNVPFDYNLYSNCHAGGVFGTGKGCDLSLWEEMTNNTSNREFTRQTGGQSFSHSLAGFRVEATMTNKAISVCDVKVYDK